MWFPEGLENTPFNAQLEFRYCRTAEQSVPTEQTQILLLTLILNIQNCRTSEQIVQTEQIQNIGNLDFKSSKFWVKCTNCTN